MDSKQALLEKSRVAREERAMAKKQDRAIVIVQSVARMYLVRCRLTNHSLALLTETLNAPDSEAKDCLLAIERFLTTHHLKREKINNFHAYTEYISFICKYVGNSIMLGRSAKLCYVGLVLQKDFIKILTNQIHSLIRLSLRHTECLHICQSAHKDLFLIYLRFSVLITDVITWKPVSSLKQFDILRPGLIATTNLFLTHYQTHGAIRIFGNCFYNHFMSGTSAQLSDNLITSVFTMVSRIFVATKYSDDSVEQYCIYFLTIPGIVALVAENPTCSAILLKDNFSIKLLNYLSFEKHLMQVVWTLDYNKLLFLLANCIHIASLDKDVALAPGVRPNFVDVITRFLAHLKNLCFFQNNSSGSKYWHEIFGNIPHTNSKSCPNLKTVKMQLSHLWKPEMVETHFSTLIAVNAHASATLAAVSHSSGSKLVAETQQQSLTNQTVTSATRPSGGDNFRITASSVPAVKSKNKASRLFKKAFPSLGASKISGKSLLALDSLEMFQISAVCQLYQLAKEVLSLCKIEILSGITHLENILPHMLHFILLFASRDAASFFTDLCSKLKSNSGQAGGTSSSVLTDLNERAFCVFCVFCECTWYLSTVLDDIEVYEQEKLFVMPDLQLLVLFLNQLCFNLIWNTNTHTTMPTFFTSVNSLLLQLVARNYRREFLPLDSLLIKELKIHAFMSEYDKGTPRAHLLIEKMPHAIPHKDRVLLFRRLVNDEKESLGLTESSRIYPKSTLITIRRTSVVEDGFEQLNANVLSDANFKGLIRVKFVNEQGLMEAGIDQDGVFKEFLEESLSKIFNPELNLFKLTEDQKLYPSPTSNMHENHIALFEYVGRLLGKAVYEGIVVEVHFASFFLTQLLGSRGALYSCIDELPSLDEQLFRSLSYVKHYDGDVADLQLTFSCDEDEMGQVTTYELTPGGSLDPVTNSNKILYIHSMALFKMHTQIKKQSLAFNRGFKSVIKQPWMGMFSGPELQRLISGDTSDIDLADMRANTIYYGGYHNNHKVIKWFWDILANEFSREERALLLKFCTSCSKPPLLGFSYLEPAFSIRRVEQPDDTDEGDTVGSIVRGFFSLSGSRRGENVSRLPTSSTCFNLLKLPHYHKKTTLRDKLRYAVHSHVGFELS